MRTRLDAAGASALTTVDDDGHAVWSITPGQRIGQYEVIRELGRGGMGQVMLARDMRLGRRVAMKFLATDSQELAARFVAEARTTAQVNHENIVVIHEVGEVADVPYMVLEYLEGATLRKSLDGERIASGRAIEIAIAIVRALVRAHAEGIVHRDLKPENVFITDAGSIKVLDFGIAKLLSQARQSPARRAASVSDAGGNLDLTSHGALVGTLPYMSPEQVGVDEIDARSDLWAVGIMLFEMVTGKHPMASTSATGLIAQLADLDAAMPRATAFVPELAEALSHVIDRCLAKRKLDRYASARELLDELELLAPGRHVRQLGEHESPYPGLVTFQEADADRFFGRDHDVLRTVTRVREQPLVGIVGPSGVGKSSFVRAGVVPALKASGEPWEVHLLRPGRQALATLANVIGPTSSTSSREVIVERLAREPGYLGAALRERAAQKQTKILLFIDQFEELYTHVVDPAERLAYTACLAAAADDSAAPVRVVVSMRSDFLDRAVEDPRFLGELTRGLVFLQPLGSAALRD
ncbi:MAG TPA: serine/threonine-protein kinase, partial [Kofleriaceae bacterium]